MLKRFQVLILLIFTVVAVCGCAEGIQEPLVDSGSYSSEISDVEITINPEQLFQRIDGFGAFGSQTVPWDSKRVSFSSRFIDDTLQNLGLTITRTQVPTSLEVQNDNQRSGSDRLEQYNQFTTEIDTNGVAYADPGKLELTGFNLDRFPISGSTRAEHRPLIYETEYLAALAWRASELKIPLKTIASIWSPPWWMKYVHAYFGVDTYWNRLSDGIQGDLPRMHEEFAEYCVAYIKLLERETRPDGGNVGDGIHLYAFSPQNEPAFGQRYASAVYSPAQYKKMLDVVGRRFKQERAHWLATINPDLPTYKLPDHRDNLDFFPDVKIFGPEDVSDLSRIHRYLSAILNDQETRNYLDIVAIHGYGDDGVTAGGSAKLWQDTYRVAMRYNKSIWQTETSGYGPKWPGNKESGSAITLARGLHNALVYGNVGAWLYWSLSENKPSKFSLTANGFPVSTYHVSTHFYRFIRPGAIRLGVTSSDEKILVSAYYHPYDYTLTLVLINLDILPRTTALRLANRSEIPSEMFEKYVTTLKKKVEQEEVTSTNSLTIEPLSITTLYSTNFPLAIDLQQMGFKNHPENASVTAGHPAEFQAVPLGPYPWHFDFQWEMSKSDNSEWQLVGENIPYFRINNTTLDHDQSSVRLQLINKDNPARTVYSDEATIDVTLFKGIEIPRASEGRTWSVKKSLDSLVDGNVDDITHNATAQLAWDETYLYLGVTVTGLTPKDSTGSPWTGNGLEFFLDTQNNKMQTYGPQHYQWFIGHTDTQNIFVEAGHYSAEMDLNTIQGESTVTPDGWRIIAKIPWNELDVDARPGMYLGFDVHLIDGEDAAEGRTSQLALFATQNDSWLNPSRFGTMRLGQ